MYGGLGGGEAVLGAATTVAGIAVLPNTGGSLVLTVLTIATIAAGSLVTGSFVVTRVVTKLNR